MTRLPPALWLLGLAVAVSYLTREPPRRAASVAVQVASAAPAGPRALRPPAPAASAR